jgi:hypothetical protein
MQLKTIGFYWTLPVIWAGFTRLSERDVEKAAEESQSIRLQREIIQRWTKEHQGELVHEQVYLEIAPDRGTDQVVHDALQPLVRLAVELNATVLYVDFGREIGWRSHHFLRNFVNEHIDRFMPVALDHNDAEKFERHFETWRESHNEWMQGKELRGHAAVKRAKQLQAQKLSLPKIAEQLNQEGLKSLSGKNWTGDNLRKFLKSISNASAG